MSGDDIPHDGESSEHGLTRREALGTYAAAGIGAAMVPGAATATAATDADGPVFEDGRAQPVFDEDDVLREEFWVETETDTTNTGDLDRIHVEIARPESTVDSDVALPVIMEPSPYFGGLDMSTADLYDVDVSLYEPDKPGRDTQPRSNTATEQTIDTDDLTAFSGSATDWIGPSTYEEYFVPRGFVFAYASSRGTHKSTGANTCGDEHEVNGIKAVVDWLNGRATAYDSRSGGDPVEAEWTTGKTGMIGASYNGTLPNGVAATGVDGLEAIVPEVAISSWYDYFRANGHVVAPGGWQGEDAYQLAAWVTTREDREVAEPILEQIEADQGRETGNYNEFWDARNYVHDADNVEAAVLITHGLNDDNVKTKQFAQWYDALRDADVSRKIWLHQGGHSSPLSHRPEEWLDELNLWWTRWLFGVENDVMDGPTATVQREDDSWTTYDEWPVPGTSEAELNFTPGGRTSGGLTLEHTRGRPVTETVVDPAEPETPADDLIAAEESEHRLLYTTAQLEEDVHLSGTVELDVRLSFDSESANVTGVLVDVGPDGETEIINRGWMNPQNRKSDSETFAIHPGTPYRLSFDLQPDDHVFAPDHRIGIAVLSTDYDFTQRPPEEKELTLDVKQSAARLPVVGGADALSDALSDD
ncbi:hydrolase CocE/NonD family protein [Natrialba magadii ATCC 43099]|uniref:Xaa-Pro dipeptidyl-peptidase n=1 Tax=Natrialba magadii (strain ATCC 43099 / DSM 3394 / CCM 3739 / CIP 104546 / IAM 13178 / JCM 8861 / NBRC 102185 / NCIMB 2190 / MS3) TaxID=547559 RepID=D3SVA1_NATMM|nr:Xaa-Pro dipeptidyl-peptidase [Natrialba magadii]ADD05509.1 hydrolase CocE/NonD family protein [Natrialba magadii ATCC 43099]ELY29528.1 x-prolyl-dipeptidyl aminopeptidase [Natrialba magadii ATCC 43099]